MLRRVLYWEAAVCVVAGALLAVVPKFVLVTLMDATQVREFAWARIAGVQLVGLALVLVLIGHSVEDRWLWAWAPALVLIGITLIALLNAAFSIPAHSAAGPWWVLGVIGLVMTAALIAGLAVAGIERPPDVKPE